MRDLGRGLQRAGAATSDAVRSGFEGAKAAATDGLDDARRAARRAGEAARIRAEAVVETGRRARRAPRRIATELRGAASAWLGGLAKALAMRLAAGAVGVAALVVLTIFLVVAFNALVGDPLGTLLVVALYAAVAGILLLAARGARARAKREVARRARSSREEVRHVAAPVRDAFGRGRSSM